MDRAGKIGLGPRTSPDRSMLGRHGGKGFAVSPNSMVRLPRASRGCFGSSTPNVYVRRCAVMIMMHCNLSGAGLARKGGADLCCTALKH